MAKAPRSTVHPPSLAVFPALEERQAITQTPARQYLNRPDRQRVPCRSVRSTAPVVLEKRVPAYDADAGGCDAHRSKAADVSFQGNRTRQARETFVLYDTAMNAGALITPPAR